MDGSSTVTSRSCTRRATSAISSAAEVRAVELQALPQPLRLHLDVDHAGAARPAAARARPARRPASGCRRSAARRRGQLVVDQDPAVVDDHHPPAEPLDVGQVVGGEQQRHVAARVHRGQERAQPLLAGQVEPDRRLVEHQQLGGVQQRGGDLAAHPLAQRQLPHRGVQEAGQVEQLARTRRAAPRSARPAPGGWRRAGRSSAVSGRSHHSWLRCPNTTPIRRASSRRRRTGSSPHTVARPAVGTSTPVSILIAVDLPAPFGPSRPTASPRRDLQRHVAQRGDPAPAQPGADQEVAAQPVGRDDHRSPFPGSAGRPCRHTSAAAAAPRPPRPAGRSTAAPPAARADRAGRAARAPGSRPRTRRAPRSTSAGAATARRS